jgi:hypothetical protein
MIISDKKKFVFIHIPKTGGTSIEYSLLKYANLRQKIVSYYPTKYLIYLINRSNINLLDNGNKWINGFHRHEKICFLEKDKKYNNYFIFTFVRNPYEWFLSLYTYIKRSKNHKDYQIVKDINLKIFLDYIIEKKFYTQSDYIYSDKYKKKINFIGKIENINNDFNFILKKLKINSKLNHKNKSYNKTYNESLFHDKKFLKKFNDYFNKDFLNFGYKFVN